MVKLSDLRGPSSPQLKRALEEQNRRQQDELYRMGTWYIYDDRSHRWLVRGDEAPPVDDVPAPSATAPVASPALPVDASDEADDPEPKGYQADRIKRVLSQPETAGWKLTDYTPAERRRLVLEQVRGDPSEKAGGMDLPSRSTLDRVIGWWLRHRAK